MVTATATAHYKCPRFDDDAGRLPDDGVMAVLEFMVTAGECCVFISTD